MRRTAGIVTLVAFSTVVGAPAQAATSARSRASVVVAAESSKATADLAVVSDRNRLRIYRFGSADRLTDVTAADAPPLFGGRETARGEAAGRMVAGALGRREIAGRTTAGQAVVRNVATDDPAQDGSADRVAAFGRYVVVSRDLQLGLFRLEERGGKVTYRPTDVLDLPGAAPIESIEVDGGVLYATQAGDQRWRIRLEGDRFLGVPRRAV